MFKLKRYFTLTSLLGFILTIVVLTNIYKKITMNSIVRHETHANIILGNALINSIWDKYKDFLSLVNNFSKNEIRNSIEIDKMHQGILQKIKSLNIYKIKIYHANKKILYSTKNKEIGLYQKKNTALENALNGKIISHLTYKNETYIFEKKKYNADLISTYIPIKNDASKTIAVFELYTDVTKLIQESVVTQYKFMSIIALSFVILYIFLYYIVNRADKILRTHEDIRSLNEKKIRHLAYHDALTGLPNRRKFYENLESLFKKSKRFEYPFGLMYIDIDQFKAVNDSMGHDMGDKLLIETVKKIKNNIRTTDTLYRLSGDEFIIILEDIKQPEDAAFVANRILSDMKIPFFINDFDFNNSVSIGISIFDGKKSSVDSLIKESDTALYKSKSEGGNCFHFYTKELDYKTHNLLLFKSDVEKAILNREFILMFQPKVLLKSQKIVGVEALLRWNHPQKGLLSPDLFIPTLEDTGLINLVGEWVIENSCQYFKNFNQFPIRIGVNASGKQFKDKRIVYYVTNILEDTNINPKNLEIEITESVLMEDVDHTLKIMRLLKEIGVCLSLDDFGTGYSSLSYLKRFPFDYLKIDKSIIKDLTVDNKNAAITVAITTLAHSLNLNIIAEGVETDEQVTFLSALGCHEAQGNLFGTPLSFEDFVDIYNNNK